MLINQNSVICVNGVKDVRVLLPLVLFLLETAEI